MLRCFDGRLLSSSFFGFLCRGRWGAWIGSPPLSFFGRIGEASNPGPGPCFHVGCSNPSGFRGKETLLAELGPGIWCLSEAQLSAITQLSTKGALRVLGFASQRDIRIHMGAPTQLRANSSWAGAWSGVLTSSDWASRALSVAWPTGTFETGRLQLVQHDVQGTPLIAASVYGYSPGNTHEAPLQMTEGLLEPLTKEVVFGRRGPRIMCGDFNRPVESLSQVAVWRFQGWVEAQESGPSPRARE